MPKNWEDASAREEEMLAQLHALGELSFDLPYTNIGKFPLKQIFLEGNVDVLGTDQPVTFDYQRNHWVNSENALFPGRTNAFPVADLVNELDAVTVTDDLRYELIDGKKYLAVYARGHFVDDFGIHWVQFCKTLTFKTRVYYKRKNCTDYNDTGDGENKP